MDDEKLEEAKKLQKNIQRISEKLEKFRNIGKEDPEISYQKFVRIEGCGNYRADDVISKSTLKTIRLIVICELEDILKDLKNEYGAL